MKRAALLLMTLLPAGGLIAQSDQFVLRTGVFCGGGGISSGQSYRMQGTLGQPLAGLTGNASNLLPSGFWYLARGVVTAVEETSIEDMPTEFWLGQNYPNPFNPTTTIQFALAERSHVVLRIFDTVGKDVATLVDEDLPAGRYTVVFDASGFPSGIYFCRLEAREPGFVATRKLILLK